MRPICNCEPKLFWHEKREAQTAARERAVDGKCFTENVCKQHVVGNTKTTCVLLASQRLAGGKSKNTFVVMRNLDYETWSAHVGSNVLFLTFDGNLSSAYHGSLLRTPQPFPRV